jgi:hypothetical protein
MSSSRVKPAAAASASQRRKISLPTPRRAHAGSTKIARIFAASTAGSSAESSRDPMASLPKSVRRLLQPPHPTICEPASTTI